MAVDADGTKVICDFQPPRRSRNLQTYEGDQLLPQVRNTSDRTCCNLRGLRETNVAFVWGPDQQKAFDDQKILIANPPVLQMLSRSFILQTDKSSIAVGIVRLQDFDWSRKPTTYVLRPLSEQRENSLPRNWSVLHYSGSEKFRQYLEHVDFDLETDNQALMWGLSNPRQLGRIGHWVMRVSSFKFVGHHIGGTQDLIAEALSQMSEDDAPPQVPPILLDFNFRRYTHSQARRFI